VDPDGHVQRMLDDVIVSNGIVFAPDGRAMLFTDTRRHTTWRFDIDLDDGTLSNRRVFADHRASGERPDGACVDADGCYWIAFFAGRRVVRYRPDGTIDLVVPMPVTNPTCVCFGGDELRTLYVTTAAKFLTPEQRAAEPLAGSLFAIDDLAQGLPEHRFGFTRSSTPSSHGAST
jgi:sugar lactone lactonase YvrE